jgi:hypothetical protein
MSNLPYKTPITATRINSTQSVDSGAVHGINFSVLNVGGYMEVPTLNDLRWLYTGGTGLITGSTVPIQFQKGTGTVFSPDVLILNSDNISSGRRRLGMMVNVIEENTTYQFNIENYDSLWNAATGATGPGGATVVELEFSTIVKNNTVQGQNFINAWTASTIQDVDAVASPNWKVFNQGTSITGGTYYSGTSTIELYNSTGGTLSITGVTQVSGGTYNPNNLSLTFDYTDNTNFNIPNVKGLFISGGTYVSPTNTIELYNSTGGTISISGITQITGGTYDYKDITLTLDKTDGTSIDISGITGVYVSGGTYVSNTNTLQLYNSTGGTVSISGITQITGASYNQNTTNLTLSKTDNTNIVASGVTGVYVSGGTYLSGSSTLQLFKGDLWKIYF